MGTWGVGGFENDTAADFAATIETVEDIAAAFGNITPGEEIDADTAQCAIAAAECVAAMLGRPPADLPIRLDETLASLGQPPPALLERARHAVSTVLMGGELIDLWAEADDPSGFNLAMTGLIDRLNPDITAAPAKRRKKSVYNKSPCAFCNEPMGEDELSMFDITVDLGSGPIRLGDWAHLTCLNARLHPAHLVQVWKIDPESLRAEADRLLSDDGDDEE